jgi:hypothetical protein
MGFIDFLLGAPVEKPQIEARAALQFPFTRMHISHLLTLLE